MTMDVLYFDTIGLGGTYTTLVHNNIVLVSTDTDYYIAVTKALLNYYDETGQSNVEVLDPSFSNYARSELKRFKTNKF